MTTTPSTTQGSPYLDRMKYQSAADYGDVKGDDKAMKAVRKQLETLESLMRASSAFLGGAMAGAHDRAAEGIFSSLSPDEAIALRDTFAAQHGGDVHALGRALAEAGLRGASDTLELKVRQDRELLARDRPENPLVPKTKQPRPLRPAGENPRSELMAELDAGPKPGERFEGFLRRIQLTYRHVPGFAASATGRALAAAMAAPPQTEGEQKNTLVKLMEANLRDQEGALRASGAVPAEVAAKALEQAGMEGVDVHAFAKGGVVDLEALYAAVKNKIDPSGLVEKFRSNELDLNALTGEEGQILFMQIKDRMTRLQAFIDAISGAMDKANEAAKKAAENIGR